MPQTDKLYTFEDPKASTKDILAASTAAQEWLETLERAKEISFSSASAGSYSGHDDSNYRGLPSTFASPAATPNSEITSLTYDSVSGHSQPQPEPETPKRKRFSKRHSKNGLTAVF